MRTFITALASALLLAFIVIQLNVLLFADDQLTVQHHLALLVSDHRCQTVINGLFNARLALRNAPARGRNRGKGRDKRDDRRGDRRNDNKRGNAAKNGKATGKDSDKEGGRRQSRDAQTRGDRRGIPPGAKVRKAQNAAITAATAVPARMSLSPSPQNVRSRPTRCPNPPQLMQNAAPSNGLIAPRVMGLSSARPARKFSFINAVLFLERGPTGHVARWPSGVFCRCRTRQGCASRPRYHRRRLVAFRVSITTNIRSLLAERIEAAFTSLGLQGDALLQTASRPEFGDYQSNGVMAAAERGVP